MRKIEKNLRERIKRLEAELTEVNKDREVFRRNLVSNLKYAIQVHGEGKYWGMASLIETFSKNISAAKHWYW
jgi:hypothetical protein